MDSRCHHRVVKTTNAELLGSDDMNSGSWGHERRKVATSRRFAVSRHRHDPRHFRTERAPPPGIAAMSPSVRRKSHDRSIGQTLAKFPYSDRHFIDSRNRYFEGDSPLTMVCPM